MNVGELIGLLRRHAPAPPVVVDGYEEGYDDPTVAVQNVVVDANENAASGEKE